MVTGVHTAISEGFCSSGASGAALKEGWSALEEGSSAGDRGLTIFVVFEIQGFSCVSWDPKSRVERANLIVKPFYFFKSC